MIQSFPSAAKDPSTVVGAIYIRAVKLQSILHCLNVLKAFRATLEKQKKLKPSTIAALADKERVWTRLAIVLTFYIGTTRGQSRSASSRAS